MLSSTGTKSETNYDVTINRIVNGYRFPKGIKKSIYSVYQDYICRKDAGKVTDTDRQYLAIYDSLVS